MSDPVRPEAEAIERLIEWITDEFGCETCGADFVFDDGRVVMERANHEPYCRQMKINAALRAYAASLRQQAPEVEAAFRAGYHCQWLRVDRRYIFTPALKPGDPDGAFWAYQKSLAEKGSPR